MKLSKQQIIKIADELDCGMKCYFNIKTGKIMSLIDSDDWFDDEENPWSEDLQEIEKNKKDYFEFEKMASRESFIVMADFTETIDDLAFQEKLIQSLNKSKPFRNFKWLIDNSNYRQEWFDFKKSRYIEFVKKQAKYLEV